MLEGDGSLLVQADRRQEVEVEVSGGDDALAPCRQGGKVRAGVAFDEGKVAGKQRARRVSRAGPGVGLDQVGNWRGIRVGESPLPRQPPYLLVAGNRFLQPAPAELEHGQRGTGAKLRQPEAEFAGQPVGVARMPAAVLITALGGLDLSDDVQRLASQDRLSGRQRQLEGLAAVRQPPGPPACLDVGRGGEGEQIREAANGAYANVRGYGTLQPTPAGSDVTLHLTG
jgi:hypothetical protein